MIRKYFMLFSLAALFFQSCKDDTFGPTVTPGAAPAITAPAAGASFVLKEADAANKFGTFSWSKADFGYEGGPAYKLEMDLSSNNFSSPVALGTVNGLSISNKTVADINNALLAKGLPGDKEVSIDLRVTALLNNLAGTTISSLVSKTVTIKVTPYEVVIPVEQLQVPGNYQGWDPSNNNTVIFSTKGDHKYEGYVYFPNATTEFKYTQGTSWDVNWGDNGADGKLEPGGANISVSGAGMYKLNVNLNDLTHSYLLTNWSIIGDAAGGWGNDTDMTYNSATGVLEATLNLTAGQIKFRANHDWAVNLGDDGADKKLDYGGANIDIASAGNYTVKLVLNVPHYTYTITKN